jgi:hypothetical protein
VGFAHGVIYGNNGAMRIQRWKAGWALAARGGWAAAALSLALLGQSASGAAHQTPSAKPAVSEAFAGDVALLGVPSSRWSEIAWDAAESVQAAKSIEGFPGAAQAAVAVYRPVGAAANYDGFDSGLVRFSADGVCRIVMPPRAAALAGLADMARVSKAEAQRLGLAQLEALHELGHCWQRLDAVAFDAPGLSAEDSKMLSERLFSPAWAALSEGGRPARLWGEAFADAFMAIEKLAASGADDAARQGLALLAKARQRAAPDADESDGGHHPGAGPIVAALADADRWASMSAPARLRAAAQIASIDVVEALGLGEPERAREAAYLVSDGQVGRLAIEDAARAWIEAAGKPEAYQASPLDMDGFEPHRAAQGARLSSLMASAKQAVRVAASRSKGFSWTMPRRKLDERGETVMRLAMDAPEFQRAIATFGQGFNADALAQTLERAGVAAKLAKSAKPDDEGPKRSLMARMGELVDQAASKTGLAPKALADPEPREIAQRRGLK